MLDIKTIENSIRKEASTVLGRVILFLVYYILLILLGIGLFVAAFWISWMLLGVLSELESINVRVIFWVGIAWLAMWWFCIQIAWYLVKPLFTVHRTSNENRREVSRDECSELFSVIADIARETGNKMPKHVYLSSELNACVFYNSTSIWSIFFPTRKNLMVGTGLLQGMNKDELKAILGHEFGHFSQQTMKVGSITYRLLLIIRGMIEFAQEEQKKASLSWANDDSWEKWFHLASGPMVFITKQTIKFYNYIEKKNRSLSRFMEFEADAVACRIVGAKPFISSLCKLDVLSERYGLYENVVAKLLQDKRYIDDYAKGYEIVEGMIAEDEGIKVSFDKSLETLISDESRYPSKVAIIDGWNTHPSITERIENAAQFIVDKTDYNNQDARELVNSAIQSEVGIMRQRFMCENFDEPISWSDVKEMGIEEFTVWVKGQFKNNRIPDFLYPFVNKRIVHFSLPDDNQLSKDMDSPFTRENRDMLLEFGVGVSDWRTLNELSNDDVKQFMYAGAKCTSASQVIESHKQYLDTFTDKLTDLEQRIFIFLCQKTNRKDDIMRIYWMIFYGSDSIDQMKDILDLTSSIKEQAQRYYESGRSFYLNDEVKTMLSQKLWSFLRSLDYERVNEICGGWQYGDDETVNQLLQKWHDYASNECDVNIAGDALIKMVDAVYELLAHIYHVGKNEWTDLLVKAVYYPDELVKEVPQES